MRLIEKKNDSIGVTVDNGALMNFIAAGGQNGALAGFELSLSSGNLVVTKGSLIIQGFTFESQGETLYDLSSVSVDSTEARILCLKVDYDATTRDSAWSFVVKKESEQGGLAVDNIQNGITGSYYFVLCSFTKSGSSIQNFQSKVKKIVIGAAASTGGNGINAVPQPVIGVIRSKSGTSGVASTDGGYIVLANALDFWSLKDSYTIKFCLYRRRQNAKYRLTTFGGKRYAKKTQWTECNIASLGWIDWTSLTFGSEVNGGTAPYKGIITTVQTFINRFFYKIEGSGSIVPGTTMTNNVRATGSKKRKKNGVVTYKHNYVEFAYKLYLLNANGKTVGESALSNSIILMPDKTRAGKTVHFVTIANR